MARCGLDVLYAATVEVTGGRDGQAAAPGGMPRLTLDHPAELGGRGAGTNPEQLLAAAFGASFGSALDLEARQIGCAVDPLRVTAIVAFGHGDEGCFAIAVELHCHLATLPRETAERLLRAARAACPYCRMVRGNLDLVIMLAGTDAP
ncbi:Ohr family peroxiredoxin [Roseomonas fluvialis]|nr:Ohr family peroxiredoxin [Roseomonas fluvialis]